MTTDQNDKHDPATVDSAKVHPNPSLGANFDVPTYPALGFSTKSKVWGDKSPGAIEPTDPACTPALRQQILAEDGHRCMFCGFYSERNEVHNQNDIHRDVRPENLRAADPLCHGWQHLGELGEGDAVVAYLPGLSGQDANHLQRTIMVALAPDEASIREEAKRLLNWMASHRDYAKDAWGTSEPGVFASALVRSEDRESRAVVFQDLAVVFNPGIYAQHVAARSQEAYRNLPVGKWYQVYHDVMNAPA